MAKIDEVQAVLDSIPPVLDAIAADEAKLAADLKACIDAGTATPEQLQKAFDAAVAIKARLDAIDLSQPAPTPVV